MQITIQLSSQTDYLILNESALTSLGIFNVGPKKLCCNIDSKIINRVRSYTSFGQPGPKRTIFAIIFI